MIKNDMVMDEYDDLGTDLPGSQRQGEPVAWLYKGTIDGDHLRRSRMDHFFVPVGGDGSEYVKGIPLYTHADPAEVERLRETLRLVREQRDNELRTNSSLERERDTLRAQLADLKRRHDGLHRDMATIAGREVPKGCTVADYAAHAIADALSASAEPSAPVELCGTCKGFGKYQDGDSSTDEDGRCPNIVDCDCDDSERMPQYRTSAPVEIDERAVFEAWHADNITPNLGRYRCGRYSSNGTESRWASWQARAALARKP